RANQRRAGVRGMARRALSPRSGRADTGGQRDRREDPVAARTARTHSRPRSSYSQRRSAMKRAIIVICDSLRADLITPRDAPFLSEFGRRSAHFANHRSVFPSTTRTSAASIATGCLPARHGLLGNTMALDEGKGLVCLSVGKPDFRDRLHRATGRTLHVPTLAERISRSGETAIAISNVSPGAAYFLDPDGFGWVYNPAGSFGPGRSPLPAEDGFAIAKGDAGDATATERFCEEVLRRRAPVLSVLWLSEPDYTGHHTALGSPA